MLRILSKIKLLCRCNFCSFYCLVFPGWCSPFRLSLPFVVHVAACWHHFFDSFRSLVFILSFVRHVSLRPINLAVWLGSCSLLHTFSYLSCQCASPRTQHRVSVVLSFWLPSPLHMLYLLFECASPRKHRGGCVVLFSSAPLSLAHVLFVM